MRALIENEPEYENVKVIGVDFDVHRSSRIARELEVRNHSTLVMFRDGVEVARLIGHVGRGPIEGLMKTAL